MRRRPFLLALFAAGACAAVSATAGATPPQGVIAYSTDKGIRTVGLDGSGRQKITTGSDQEPVWSPNGRRLAFVRGYGAGATLYVVNRNGSGLRRIAPVRGGVFAWSPDSSRLAFDRFRLVECSAGKPFSLRITIADLSSGRSADLIALPKPEKLVELTGLSWSPDGARLLYEVDKSPTDDCGHDVSSRLYTIGADGAGRRLVVPEEGSIFSSAWSPEGKRIAFHGSDSVSLVNADGTHLSEIAERDAFPVPADGLWWLTDLVWDPSGLAVLLHVASAVGAGPEGVYSADLATHRVRTVVRWKVKTGGGGNLAVSPDGRRIGVQRADGVVFVLDRGRVAARVRLPGAVEAAIYLP